MQVGDRLQQQLNGCLIVPVADEAGAPLPGGIMI